MKKKLHARRIAEEIAEKYILFVGRDEYLLVEDITAAINDEIEACYLVARGHEDGDGFAKHGNKQLYWKGRSDAATEIRARKDL